jgi:hypothetical protein
MNVPRWSGPIARSIAAAVVLSCGLASLEAQQPTSKPAQPSKPAPRTASGKPDLSGVWDHPYVPDMTKTAKDQRGHAELPYTTAGLQEWKAYDAANGDYTGSCMPFGMTRSFNAPYPIQFIQTDAYVAWLFELNTWFHIVPVDGKPLAKELEPTWFGTSAGRWEGDTLVVETAGFNGWTKLDTIGHPHSDGLRLVQTFRRPDFDHIVYSVTVIDPETYTKPWTNERTFTRMDSGLIEYSCEENNKDLREGHIKMWTPPPPKQK